MSDKAMIGFAMGLAHEAGRKREDLTESRVADIIREARRLSDVAALPELPATIDVGAVRVSVADLQYAFRNDALARVVLKAVTGNLAYNLKPVTVDEPSPEEDDLTALLAIRNNGPINSRELSCDLQWSTDRTSSAIRRLAKPSFIERYSGGYYTVTDKGRARLWDAGLV